MALHDNMTNNGWSFFGVNPIGTDTTTYLYLDFGSNRATQVQSPVDGDFNSATLRHSPSWFAGVGVALGTVGTLTVTLDYSEDLNTWTPVTNEFLTWEKHQTDGGINKRIQEFGDSYILEANLGNQIRLFPKCTFRYYRLGLLTSGDYVDSASLGVNISTFCERYTGFDKLVV